MPAPNGGAEVAHKWIHLNKAPLVASCGNLLALYMRFSKVSHISSVDKSLHSEAQDPPDLPYFLAYIYGLKILSITPTSLPALIVSYACLHLRLLLLTVLYIN